MNTNRCSLIYGCSNKSLRVKARNWHRCLGEEVPGSWLQVTSFRIPSLTCLGTLTGLSRKSTCLQGCPAKSTLLQPRTIGPASTVPASRSFQTAWTKHQVSKACKLRKLQSSNGDPSLPPNWGIHIQWASEPPTYCFTEHHLLQCLPVGAAGPCMF